MRWYQKEVTWGILIKLMICLNIFGLVMLWRVCNIRTTQDQETLNYINELEETIQREKDYRNVLWNYINYIKSE